MTVSVPCNATPALVWKTGTQPSDSQPSLNLGRVGWGSAYSHWPAEGAISKLLEKFALRFSFDWGGFIHSAGGRFFNARRSVFSKGFLKIQPFFIDYV